LLDGRRDIALLGQRRAGLQKRAKTQPDQESSLMAGEEMGGVHKIASSFIAPLSPNYHQV
jgi:hypothetical protein